METLEDCLHLMEDLGNEKKLHQIESMSSIDSGSYSMQASRNPSSSSLLTPNGCSASIDGDNPRIDTISEIPNITVDDVDEEPQKMEEYHVDLVDPVLAELLDVDRRDRKNSNTGSVCSNVSEYYTAPSTPDLPRTMSLDRLPSVACSTQAVATHVEKKKDRLRIMVDVPSRPIELKLRFPSQTFTLSTSKNSPTSSNPSTPEDTSSFMVTISNERPSSPTNGNLAKNNDAIAEVIRRNLVQFSEHTNLDNLYPHLISSNLICTSDYEYLEAYKTTASKMNYFYIFLLHKKGKNAYSEFFKCLLNEKAHRGHFYLVDMIKKELQR